jgi:hypothetical protein
MILNILWWLGVVEAAAASRIILLEAVVALAGLERERLPQLLA